MHSFFVGAGGKYSYHMDVNVWRNLGKDPVEIKD
jgi:hypothetical protein